MASLQEQLLKAGLADKSKAKQARSEKRKKQKLKNKGAAVELDASKVAAQAAAEAKKERDRELNQQRKAEADKKAVVAQIRQLITTNQQPKGENVVVYRADLREENKAKSEEDDWYADYEIPDDLTW